MPVVNVYYDRTLRATMPPKLKASLAFAIARNLNVGTPSISTDDVTVIFQEFGPHDAHKHDVVITVTAHDFPERVSAHQEITAAIVEEVAAVLRNCSFSIVVNLTKLEWASVEWVAGVRKVTSA